MLIADVFSQIKLVEASYFILWSSNMIFIHSTSQTHWATALNSDSALDLASLCMYQKQDTLVGARMMESSDDI